MNELSLKDSTVNNVKELAFDLGITKKQVYNHLKGAVKATALRDISIWMDHTEGDELIDKLCATQDGYFYREIKNEAGDFKVVATIIKEFGEFVTAIADGQSDGVITRSELNRIKKEFGELNVIALGMILGIERELEK